MMKIQVVFKVSLVTVAKKGFSSQSKQVTGNHSLRINWDDFVQIQS
jgi:hypothetical protein